MGWEGKVFPIEVKKKGACKWFEGKGSKGSWLRNNKGEKRGVLSESVGMDIAKCQGPT